MNGWVAHDRKLSVFSNFCFAKMLLISRSAKSHRFRVRCRIDASYIITFGGFGSYRIFVLFSFSSITFSSSFFYKRIMNIAVDFLSILSLHIIVSPMPSYFVKMLTKCLCRLLSNIKNKSMILKYVEMDHACTVVNDYDVDFPFVHSVHFNLCDFLFSLAESWKQ